MLAYSELSEMKSAIAPSDAILVPLGMNCITLVPNLVLATRSFQGNLPLLNAVAVFTKDGLLAAWCMFFQNLAFLATLADKPRPPPIPRVAYVKATNSVIPRVSLPKPELFSGSHASGISSGFLIS